MEVRAGAERFRIILRYQLTKSSRESSSPGANRVAVAVTASLGVRKLLCSPFGSAMLKTWCPVQGRLSFVSLRAILELVPADPKSKKSASACFFGPERPMVVESTTFSLGTGSEDAQTFAHDGGQLGASHY